MVTIECTRQDNILLRVSDGGACRSTPPVGAKSVKGGLTKADERQTFQQAPAQVSSRVTETGRSVSVAEILHGSLPRNIKTL